jgi:RHS repeat-associated protein
VYDTENRLTDDGTYTYSYDNNGNRLTRTEKATGNITNYTWDAENRLIEVQMPGGSIVQYEYDPFGRRIQKNVNGTITQYLYDNQNILFEYDQNGNVLSAFTHGAGIDEPLMWSSNGTTYYYHADALGSIRMISNASGSVIQTNVYDAFGSIQSGNTLSQPYAFTGREYDAETGLYYYRARYYDPLTGRFISRDPILHPANVPPEFAMMKTPVPSFDSLLTNPLNLNAFSYGLNNPVNRKDPLGLDSLSNIIDLISNWGNPTSDTWMFSPRQVCVRISCNPSNPCDAGPWLVKDTKSCVCLEWKTDVNPTGPGSELINALTK